MRPDIKTFNTLLKMYERKGDFKNGKSKYY
jgi:hypothetical protein